MARGAPAAANAEPAALRGLAAWLFVSRPVVAVAAGALLLRLGLFAGLELYFDEAYYWTWSRHPAAGYFDHPPLVAWLATFSRLFPGEFGLRLPSAVLGASAILLCAGLARDLSDRPRAPLLAAVLAALCPALVLTGSLALPDAPAVALSALAMRLMLRDGTRAWLAAGAAAGLALLSKYNTGVVAVGLLASAFFAPRLRAELRTRGPWLGALVAAALFLPCLHWNARNHWISLRFQLAHGLVGGAGPADFALFLAGQLAVLGPVVLPLGLAGLFRVRSERGVRLGCMTVSILLLGAWSAARARAEWNWTAAAAPALCAGTAVALSELARALRPILAISLAFSVLPVGWLGAEVRAPFVARPTDAPFKRFHGWRDMAQQARRAAGDDPYVLASNYQAAAQLSYYAGWRRFGPTRGRPSQFDLWAQPPREGETAWVLEEAAASGSSGMRLQAVRDGVAFWSLQLRRGAP